MTVVREDFAKETLRYLGITDPDSLAKWAKSKGLLGVYIFFRARTTYMSGAWQVVRPGYKTDPNTLATNLGRKTFKFEGLREKHLAEQRAKDWADNEFGGGHSIGWWRIEHFGPNLFPESVARELNRFLPELKIYAQRQHTVKKKAAKKPSRYFD
jgi:hypothetical protein